jgi:hypothetical protein
MVPYHNPNCAKVTSEEEVAIHSRMDLTLSLNTRHKFTHVFGRTHSKMEFDLREMPRPSSGKVLNQGHYQKKGLCKVLVLPSTSKALPEDTIYIGARGTLSLYTLGLRPSSHSQIVGVRCKIPPRL